MTNFRPLLLLLFILGICGAHARPILSIPSDNNTLSTSSFNSTSLLQDPAIDVASIFKDFAGDIFKTIASKAGDTVFGWVLNALGFGQPSLSDVMSKLREIDMKLDILKNDLDTFEQEIMNYLKQFQWDLTMQKASEYMNIINTANNQMQRLMAQPVNNYTQMEVAGLVQQIIGLNGVETALLNIHNIVLDGGNTLGLLTQYMQSVQSSYIATVQAKATTDSCKVMYTDNYYDINPTIIKIFSFFQQLLAIQIQGLYLMTEAYHYNHDTGSATVFAKDFQLRMNTQMDAFVKGLTTFYINTWIYSYNTPDFGPLLSTTYSMYNMTSDYTWLMIYDSKYQWPDNKYCNQNFPEAGVVQQPINVQITSTVTQTSSINPFFNVVTQPVTQYFLKMHWVTLNYAALYKIPLTMTDGSIGRLTHIDYSLNSFFPTVDSCGSTHIYQSDAGIDSQDFSTENPVSLFRRSHYWLKFAVVPIEDRPTYTAAVVRPCT